MSDDDDNLEALIGTAEESMRYNGGVPDLSENARAIMFAALIVAEAINRNTAVLKSLVSATIYAGES